MEREVVTFVLAGGSGNRLFPLTEERAKPAVPFGGKYRIIDFVLSNLINSGIYSIYVLTQYMSQSLLRHLRDGWQFGGLLRDHFIIPAPAQVRSAHGAGYRGTADAIFQNLDLIDHLDEHVIAIFGADHIYRMNIRHMIDFHEHKHSDVTVAAIPVSAHLAAEFGVLEVAADDAVRAFHEKNANAPTIPDTPDKVYASMGNYVFSAPTLVAALQADALREDSKHDFGFDVLPSLIGQAAVYAYDYQTNVIPGETENVPAYWRDVGTLEAYYDAHMDLCGLIPSLNLYNRQWPIRTASYPDPSAKFSFDENGDPGQATGSIVSGGCILSGGMVRGSVLGRSVLVGGQSVIEDSIILDNCQIGRHCRIQRAIVDENVVIPDGFRIGQDPESDRIHHHVSATGIAVVTSRSMNELDVAGE
jgi:glucose-1-phosphate adenylyltransferase